MKIAIVDSIEKIAITDWQQLNTSTCPFLNYAFYQALENSGSVSIASGWQPQHLTIIENDHIVGIIPLYLKQHSWGEYVFDWDWAEAYQRNNLPYYPKLVATIPFTPVTSAKLISTTLPESTLLSVLSEYCQQHNIHSWHWLFSSTANTNNKDHDSSASTMINSELTTCDVYQRHSVQFHWFNNNYQTFDDLLTTFTARKRKNTRKERLSIIEQGVAIRHVLAANASKQELEFFYLTYQLTYLKKGHQPHLNFAFFQQIFTTMADNILLIIASANGEDIACSLFFYDQSHLYGRYWGCSVEVKNLHFELCYYQGIDFCIKNKLTCFNPGTQGEHKIQRGFEPVLTHSYHWIKHPAFKNAINNFCQQEREQIKIYQQQCRQALPYKQTNI